MNVNKQRLETICSRCEKASGLSASDQIYIGMVLRTQGEKLVEGFMAPKQQKTYGEIIEEKIKKQVEEQAAKQAEELLKNQIQQNTPKKENEAEEKVNEGAEGNEDTGTQETEQS